MASEITSREDLPFTRHEPREGFVDWHLGRRDPNALHAPAALRGQRFFVDVAHLAEADEFEAYSALRGALLGEHWDRRFGEEDGFASALAATAVVGLRAQRAREALPFDAAFDATTAQWLSMQRRIALMEAQLKALNQRPWRRWEQAAN